MMMRTKILMKINRLALFILKCLEVFLLDDEARESARKRREKVEREMESLR